MQQVIDTAEVAKWISILNEKKMQLGAVRDEIRDARMEMEMLEDNAEEAYYSIESAIDSLSELV